MPPMPVQPHRNEAAPVPWNRVGERLFNPTLLFQGVSKGDFRYSSNA